MNPPASPASRLLRKAQTGDDETPRATGGKAGPIRVLLVDNSLTVRTIFRRMVESDGAMEVTATASSAERAISQLKFTPVDVILLDLEMPGMGGLEGLPAILQTAPDAQVLVVSSLTEDGAEATVAALSQGAADTMLKPRPGGFNDDYRTQLLGKIRALGSKPENVETPAPPPPAPKAEQRTRRPDLIAIGASTGGIHALNLMLRALTPEFDLPILITQHLPASFIPVFARQIEVASGRPTRIAEAGTEIRRGEIAIATGHGHMVLRRVGDRLVTTSSNEPTSSGCLPSVDPMLSSAANACDGRVLGIILSGMGRDGVLGAKHLVAAGGTVWAQNAETSAVWGMPGAVAKAGLTSHVASPELLGGRLMALFARGASAETVKAAP